MTNATSLPLTSPTSYQALDHRRSTGAAPGVIGIWARGEEINRTISHSETLPIPPVGPHSCAIIPFAANVADVEDGDPVSVGVPSYVANTTGLFFSGFVAFPGQVSLKICNIAAVASPAFGPTLLHASITQFRKP